MQVQFVEPDMKYTFGNHNRLLTAYEGCIRVKTGFTKKSGGAWFRAERDGVRLVAVTLNAPDDWNDHKAMLDYGFSKVKQVSFDDTALGLRCLLSAAFGIPLASMGRLPWRLRFCGGGKRDRERIEVPAFSMLR